MGVAVTVGHQTIRYYIISYLTFGPKFGDFGDFGFSEGRWPPNVMPSLFGRSYCEINFAFNKYEQKK